MNVAYSKFVDFEHLETELDAECTRELTAAFLQDTAGVIQSISEAAASGNSELARAKSHLLKGCCRSIAARSAEEIAGQLEKLAMANDLVNLQALLPQSSAIYEETSKAIRSYLAGSQA